MRIILNLSLLGLAGSVFMMGASGSGPGAAPEIDPASAASALAFVVGALAVVRGRRKRSIPTN
jgi:hypothetical protein